MVFVVFWLPCKGKIDMVTYAVVIYMDIGCGQLSDV